MVGMVHSVMMTIRSEGPMTPAMRKKLLDREVTWDEIAEKDRPLYERAREAEWDCWLRFGSVRVCTEEESKRILQNVPRRQILGTDFKYKDKNAALRSQENPLDIKAKARLCVQASREPMAASGEVKLDSPTVQRTGVLIFWQIL